MGGSVAGVFGVIGLPFLNYETLLSQYDIQTLINYDSE
jgi:adenine/guanine phosphoribosyltransferase-like PRPP-binding protein